MTRSSALCFVEPGRTETRRVRLPALGKHDLLVRVRVGGLCRADVDVFRGDSSISLPYFGGHESAGTVVVTGSSVRRFRPGDNVAMLGDGRFSELTVCGEHQAALLPQDITDWSSWVVEPMACCVNGVEVANVQADDIVGVVGCGFMGLAILRVLGLTPVRQLLGFDVRRQRLDDALLSGAGHVFRGDGDAVMQAVRGIAQRRPMPNAYVFPGLDDGPLDIVFETSGTASGLALASGLARVGGTVVMFGHQRGPLTVDGTQWHLKGLRVLNASPMIATDFYQVFYRTAALMKAGRLGLEGLISHHADAREASMVLAESTSLDYVKGVVTFTTSAGGKA